MLNHQKYMQRAIELALQGKGYVAPNPCVGSVIVFNDTIIGEGYHEKYGGPHAEVNAINSIAEKDQDKLSESTIYVTLEPCAHFGNTPPCVNRIIKERIPQVVIAGLDPHIAVAGKGVQILKENGVDVLVGILEEQARNLNPAFLQFHSEGLPWVTLKWASSKDGFLAAAGRKPVHMTGEESDRMVHSYRAHHQAILIGAATAISDNPQLTIRLVKGRNPIRIVLSDGRPLPKGLSMLNDGTDVLVLELNHENFYDIFISKMKEFNIISILVEGGAATLDLFLKHSLWNEIHRFTTPLILKEGIPAPLLDLIPNETKTVGSDILEIYRQ